MPIESELVSFKPTMLDRLFNVHTLKAIGVALAGFGFLSADKLQALIENSGGDALAIAIGIGGYVLANVIRAH